MKAIIVIGLCMLLLLSACYSNATVECFQELAKNICEQKGGSLRNWEPHRIHCLNADRSRAEYFFYTNEEIEHCKSLEDPKPGRFESNES